MEDDVKNEDGSPKVPTWILDRMEVAERDLHQVMDVLHLSMQGISGLQATPRLLETLSAVHGEASEESERRLSSARRAADLAQSEVQNDFPLLHRQAVLSICSIMESLVWDLCVLWVDKHPSGMESPEIRALTVELGEYLSLDEDDRGEYLISTLSRSLRSEYAQGVSGFERLLSVFGLGGFVADQCKRMIFEMFKVRNVIVHRGGTVDRKLCLECPWLDVSPGDPIQVTHDKVMDYAVAMDAYLSVLTLRMGDRFGVASFSRRLQDYRKRLKDSF